MPPWVIAIIAVAGAVIGYLWWRRRQLNAEVIFAVVLMVGSPRLLRKEIVEAAVAEGFREELDVPVVTEQDTSYFLLDSGELKAKVFSSPNPYVPASKLRNDERLYQIAQESHGCIILEIISTDEWPRLDALAVLGRVAAELMDGDTKLVYLWPHQRINVATEELRERLANGELIDAMMAPNYDSVTNHKGNRSVDAAIEEAQRRWPEFASAFAQRSGSEEESYIAKFRFAMPGDESNGEHMWIRVESIDDQTVSGELLNEPLHIPGLRVGDRVHRNLDDLSDWLYASESGMEGGFVERVLRGGK